MGSPWVTILYKPTQTIKEIVKANPNKGLWLLSTIFGLAHLLQVAQIYALSERFSLSTLLLGCIVLAPFWGYLIFSIASALIFFTGKWIKGKGYFAECRAALAWSCLPLFIAIAAWFVLLWLFGQSLFSFFPGGERLTVSQVFLLTTALLIQVGALIYSFVLYTYTLAAVQRFSPLRAIVNIVIALSFVIFLILVLYLLAVLLWVYAA